MKKLFPLFLLLVLLGAGCASSQKSSNKADGGVYKTVNAGKQWGQAFVVPTAKGIGTLATANILNLKIDPQDHQVLYAGTREDGLLYSEDAGASWRQPRNKDLTDGLIASIDINPKNVCHVYVAKGSRLYSSTDCLRSFQSDTYLESRPQVFVNRVAVDWFNPNIVWIGLSNGDVQKSLDAGKTWSNAFHAESAVIDFLVSFHDSRSLLVATADDGLFKTVDGGSTWSNISETTRELDGADVLYKLIQTSNSGVVIAATKYGLLRSEDFGSTWSPIKLVTSPGQVSIRAIAIDPSNADRLSYATTSTFYRSEDGGNTWQTSKFPSARAPRAMLIDPSVPSMVYIGVASETK